MIKTFILYKLVDYCLDVLFNKMSAVFVDSRDIVNEIKVGNTYSEIYSIFFANNGDENIRVENRFYKCTIVVKEKSYIELMCCKFDQVYTFNSHEDAVRFNSNKVHKVSHSIQMYSISKAEVISFIDDNFLRVSTVNGNQLIVSCFMSDYTLIQLPITCKPEGIMSITE
jgi:hypothetical protein